MAEEAAIIARVLTSPLDVDAAAWNALLAQQNHSTPFLRHEYLAALHESGSATPRTGWTPRFMTLWEGDTLVAACPLYLKNHSYGEYVFDWAWASAYEQHGVPYYPKAVVAVPFTPVPGTRLLARDKATRALLLQAVRQWCEQEGVCVGAHVVCEWRRCTGWRRAGLDAAAHRAVSLEERSPHARHWRFLAAPGWGRAPGFAGSWGARRLGAARRR